jgi:hypothetical protein
MFQNKKQKTKKDENEITNESKRGEHKVRLQLRTAREETRESGTKRRDLLKLGLVLLSFPYYKLHATQRGVARQVFQVQQ